MSSPKSPADHAPPSPAAGKSVEIRDSFAPPPVFRGRTRWPGCLWFPNQAPESACIPIKSKPALSSRRGANIHVDGIGRLIENPPSRRLPVKLEKIFNQPSWVLQ